jgi:hypothetical protein
VLLTTAEAPLDQLASIGLDELIARACLLTRVDRKYIVPRESLSAVLADLDPDTRVLEITGIRGFGYESVYFDTPERTSYWMAARPRRRRFKVRTRTYVDSSECYLEVKTRGARSSTVKDRIAYDPSDRRTLTAAGLDYAEETFAATGITGVDPRRLEPVLTTRYTLFVPTSQSRATIDTNLEWFIDADRHLDRPDMAIVETKSGSRASDVDRVLWSHGHRPSTISKYGTGMAALDTALAANKWSRILREQFLRPVQPPVAQPSH